jgi:phage protein D
MTPTAGFRITLNGEDLSPKIHPRLISLSITEKRVGDADQLDLMLDDSDGRMALPPEGAELTVEIGWKAGNGVPIGLVDKGRFTADTVEHSGPLDTISIKASAAGFASALTTRREQSWHATTLGAIITTIAGRHKPQARCAPALASIAIKAASQQRESDIALLRRLGREHDAVATIKRGCLIFAAIGAGITATGLALPSATIRRCDGDRHSYSVEKRGVAGKVLAEWHDRKGSRKKEGKRRQRRRRRAKDLPRLCQRSRGEVCRSGRGKACRPRPAQPEPHPRLRPRGPIPRAVRHDRRVQGRDRCAALAGVGGETPAGRPGRIHVGG